MENVSWKYFPKTEVWISRHRVYNWKYFHHTPLYPFFDGLLDLVSGLFGADSCIIHEKKDYLPGLIKHFMPRIVAYYNKKNNYNYEIGSNQHERLENAISELFKELLEAENYDEVQEAIDEAIYAPSPPTLPTFEIKW